MRPVKSNNTRLAKVRNDDIEPAKYNIKLAKSDNMELGKSNNTESAKCNDI